MVKFTSSLLVAALIAAPVLASSTWDDLDSRDIVEHTSFGRELAETEAVYARELDELFARVSDDLAARGDVGIQDLAERSKAGNFFKKLWGGIKKVFLRSDEGDNEVFARDADALESRELEDLFERYIEEIEERTPGFFDFLKHGMKSVKAIAHKDDPPAAAPVEGLEAREFEDFSERDLLDEEDLVQRDLDIEAREYEELSERDLLDEEDLVQRDLDLDLGLVERDNEDAVYVREYELDLLEREFEQDLLERELEAREIDELD